MWSYSQSTGQLSRDGNIVATGYSGRAEGRNNSTMQDRHNVGPIPRGVYSISDPFDTETHGPFVLRLTPDVGNEMFGRSGFLMHGDNAAHDASEGCIIMPRDVREAVAASGEKQIEVTV